MTGLLLAAGCWLGCSPEPTRVEVQAEPAPMDVAEVNGERISATELDEFIAAESLSSGNSAERSRALRQLIEQKALAQEARKSGFEATPEEIDQVSLLPSADEEENAYSRNRLADYLVIQKLMRDRLNAADEISLRSLLLQYERNMDQYQIDDQYRVLEILLDEAEQAGQVRETLQPGDFRGFRERARDVSSGVGAESGGDLGLYQRGELPPRFEDVIFNLQVGEVSQVFRSELGHHIFMVEEIVPRHAQKFYEVMEDVFAELVAEEERKGLDSLVNQIMDSASITILDPALSRDWSRTDAQLH